MNEKKKNKESIAIKVEGVSKTFKVPHEKHMSLKSAAIHMFNKKTYEEFEALKNISFEVKKGEFFGIIGRNGSGKSTLLKILAGIYVADSGKVTIDGKLSPFLELGVGFNPELTGRENLFLGGSILGLSRQEVAEKFEKIVSFAELEDFIDMKLKNYSSGMQVRLAFSLAINVHAEILLMDEVLAVGDEKFQKKCIEEFLKFKRSGKTIILVTHDLANIESYCDRALLLKDGKIVEVGNPKKVVFSYREQEDAINNESSKDQKKIKDVDRWGNGMAFIRSISLLDANNKENTLIKQNESLSVKVEYDLKKNITKPNFGVAIFRKTDDLYCYDINTDLDNLNIKNKTIKENGEFKITFKNINLIPGEYYLKVGIFSDYTKVTYDFINKGPVFRIKSSRNDYGVLHLDHEWDLRKVK